MSLRHAKGGVGSAIRDIVNESVNSVGAGTAHRLLHPSEHPIPGLDPSIGTRRFERSGRGPLSLFRMARALWAEVESYRPHIVHAHSTFAGLVARMVLARKWLKKDLALIYTAHGWSFDRPGNTLVAAIYACVESVLSRMCDRIICLSRHELKLARKAKISARKLRVIYNAHPGVGLAGGERKADSPREYRALFVGRFDRQKGFDILLEAIQLLEGSDIKFTIIGEAVRDGGVRPDIPQRIEVLGWQPPDVVYRQMRRATVLVVPSRWEGFALAPLEAMCLGTPVLSSSASSLPEAVVEGVSGKRFQTGTAKELAAILRATSVEEWNRLGVQAEGFCKANFSPDSMLRATYELYKEVGG